jgi:ketosteroid isomerase-like protein
MAEVLVSNLDQEGEGRPFRAHGHAVLANAGAVSVLRGTFEPGWRWSNDVAPMAGTPSCQVHHQGYVLSGGMRIRMDSGEEHQLRAGDVFDIAPGHDGWVDGDEPCVMLDVAPQATRYAVGRPTDIEEPEDQGMKLVRRGYTAFNAGDVDTLLELFASDAVQHVPGEGPLAGTYKGPQGILGYYARLAELTDGTFRADLVDVHGDRRGHVLAVHQASSVRHGVKRVSRGSILFTLLGDKVTDMLELYGDLPGDEAHLTR